MMPMKTIVHCNWSVITMMKVIFYVSKPILGCRKNFKVADSCPWLLKNYCYPSINFGM